MLADMVSVPPAVGVTTMVAKNVFDAAIEGQLQVTVPVPGVQVPPLPVTDDETYVELVGSVIVRTGFVPCEELALKVEIV
jgi:hypothetical protein